MAIIISLLMSLNIFTNNVHTPKSTTTPDSKHHQDNSNTRSWDWEENG